ncbi:MAG: cytochrome c [Chitinophagaceae bacterium]
MKKLLVLSVLIVSIAACHKKAAPTTAVPAAAPVDATVEAGHNIYTTKCTKCHAAKVVDNYTTEKWADILKAMIPKAKLDETEAAQVTAYVNANAKKM